MRWKVVLEKHGYQIEEAGADPDPFLFLSQQCRERGEPTSTVSFKTSLDFAKVSCMVTISCPQDEHHINLAGELCFRKCLELTNWGAANIGEAPIPSTG